VLTLRLSLIPLLVSATLTAPAAAQTLTTTLFERYLDSLREQQGIPGMAAALVQDGQIVWERGFGLQNVEASVAVRPDTPFLVADLSQALASTVLLRKCVDQSHMEVSDPLQRWLPRHPEPNVKLNQLLRHAAPSGGYQYDPSRFAWLSDVIDECSKKPYPTQLAEEVFDRLGMVDSVPGRDLEDPASPSRLLFTPDRVERYTGVLKRLAVPYRVDSRGRPVRSEYPPKIIDASTGVVSTVRDLARFDAALDRGFLLQADTLELSWSAVAGMPTGLGWFVQRYNGELLIWHFGYAKDAFSSLIVKVPSRRLTMILLANSDGLSAPFALSNGDVTRSLFATLFLRLALP
jgi:CubicO group peptidase (beta-lactamase class C family)